VGDPFESTPLANQQHKTSKAHAMESVDLSRITTPAEADTELAEQIEFTMKESKPLIKIRQINEDSNGLFLAYAYPFQLCASSTEAPAFAGSTEVTRPCAPE